MSVPDCAFRAEQTAQTLHQFHTDPILFGEKCAEGKGTSEVHLILLLRNVDAVERVELVTQEGNEEQAHASWQSSVAGLSSLSSASSSVEVREVLVVVLASEGPSTGVVVEVSVEGSSDVVALGFFLVF